MTATVKDLCDVMEEWAPAALAYDWDRVGLQIGDPGATLSKVLTCLTVTDAVVAKAEQWGADAIVAHHPILFKPLSALRTDDRDTLRCLRLAQKNIACFVAHTNLDVVPGGVNTLLATTLGLQEIAPLIPTPRATQVKVVSFVPTSHAPALRDALAAAGAGHLGDYTECSFSTTGTGTFRPGAMTSPFSGKKGLLNSEAETRLEMVVLEALLGRVLTALRQTHPYEEPAYDVIPLKSIDKRFGLGARGILPAPVKLRNFAQEVRHTLKLKHVRLVGSQNTMVQRVAVCGGSGGGELRKVPGDIDVYVTGDLKYHDSDHARERGLALIDAGHIGTERGIAPHMAAYLRKRLAKVTVKSILEPELFQVVTD